TVIAALGVPGGEAALLERLKGSPTILILDNCEHVLDAAAALAVRLLDAAPALKILATSQVALGIDGEARYELAPLALDDAVELFARRATRHGDDPTELCRALDGLPLAIELAAARTKLLAPERLLERLGSVLPLLTGGNRDAPERQRTLRATLEWSYDLLDPPVQALFARLGVFAGAFSFAASEEVAGADLDDLEALVDSSLVKPIGDDRFLMLETIREYAAEKLAGSAAAEEVRRRHAAFFSALAEEAYAHRFDAEAEWSERLELDHGDIRAALDWLETNDRERALALAGALGWFWLSHGHLSEGRDRLARAIIDAADESSHGARALTAAGALTARCGDVQAGRALLERGIDAWAELDDRAELAAAHDALGWLLVYDAGDDRASLRAFERSLDLQRRRGDAGGETRALVGVCQVLVALGEVARAEELSRELLERAAGDPRTEHFAYHFLADCSLIGGETREAATRYRQSLEAALLLGDVIETSLEVQGVAMAAAGNGDPKLALRLAGAVAALWESVGTSLSVAFWDALLERFIGAARAELAEEADAVWAEGRALTFDDAVDLALKIE
ncbi:MAG: ATP-binding protein, partial [Gaiellaceae bacterium]